jgi:predicted RNase H-like nuclease
MHCIGVDGIRGGWITAHRAAAGGTVTLERIDTLDQLARSVHSSDALVTVIDIPLGLMRNTPRRADEEARVFLGRKGSSVFPSPYHGMLAAAHLPLAEAQVEAGRLRRELDGGTKGCTIQTAAILPKIAEAEEVISGTAAPGVYEGHPEVTFAILNKGSPLGSKKKRVVGRVARLDLLSPYFGDLRSYLEEGRFLGANPDDVLDAFAMLHTAHRIALSTPDIKRFPLTPEPAMGGKTAQIVA